MFKKCKLAFFVVAVVVASIVGWLFSGGTALAQWPPISIFPICSVEGPVYLVFVNENRLSGRIGSGWFEFDVDRDTVYTRINGKPVELAIRGNRVFGTIGSTSVDWRVAPERDVVFGIQPCAIREDRTGPHPI